jgi:hypothetical protein
MIHDLIENHGTVRAGEDGTKTQEGQGAKGVHNEDLSGQGRLLEGKTATVILLERRNHSKGRLIKPSQLP